MKKLLSILILLVIFLISMTTIAGAEDILLCKKTYSNGVSKYAFPSGSTGMCPSDWQTISLQEALAGMLAETNERLDALEANAPVKYDRMFHMYTNGYPTFPDPWICSDGTYTRVLLPDKLPHGWDTVWSNYHGWMAVGYYKCIPGSGPSCPAE